MSRGDENAIFRDSDDQFPASGTDRRRRFHTHKIAEREGYPQPSFAGDIRSGLPFLICLTNRMALPTSQCFAGRIITRPDLLDGLNWSVPCPVPSEIVMPTEPPMYFCVQHGRAAENLLYRVFDQAGLIDHSAPAAPPDGFDELVQQLGPLEGQ